MCSVEYCCLPAATLVSGTLQVSVEPEGAILVVGTPQVSVEQEGAILVTNTLQGFCASVEPEAARSEMSTELEWKWTRKVKNEFTYTNTSPLQHDSIAIPVTGTFCSSVQQEAARSEKLNEFKEQNRTRTVGNEVTPTNTCTSPLYLQPPLQLFSLVNDDSQTYLLPPSVEQTHGTRPLHFDTSSSADNSDISLLLETNKTNKELREEFLGIPSTQRVVEGKAARSELMERELGILCTYCLCVCAYSAYPISSSHYVN